MDADASLSPITVSGGRDTPSSPWTVTTVVSERTRAVRRWRTAAALTAATLGLVILGVGNQVRVNARHARIEPTAGGRAPSAEVPLPPPQEPTPAAPAPTPSPEPSAVTSTRRVSVAPRPRPPVNAKRCAPPYTFDAEGHKIYKPECY
jgi:hypothetical protein